MLVKAYLMLLAMYSAKSGSEVQKWWFWREKTPNCKYLLDEDDGQMQEQLAEELNIDRSTIFRR